MCFSAFKCKKTKKNSCSFRDCPLKTDGSEKIVCVSCTYSQNTATFTMTVGESSSRFQHVKTLFDHVSHETICALSLVLLQIRILLHKARCSYFSPRRVLAEKPRSSFVSCTLQSTTYLLSPSHLQQPSLPSLLSVGRLSTLMSALGILRAKKYKQNKQNSCPQNTGLSCDDCLLTCTVGMRFFLRLFCSHVVLFSSCAAHREFFAIQVTKNCNFFFPQLCLAYNDRSCCAAACALGYFWHVHTFCFKPLLQLFPFPACLLPSGLRDYFFQFISLITFGGCLHCILFRLADQRRTITGTAMTSGDS